MNSEFHTGDTGNPAESMKTERRIFLSLLLWSVWLVAEYWIFGPFSYVRIHDTANTWLPVIMSYNDCWSDMWRSSLTGWLCTIDRLSNFGWWSGLYLPFVFLPPWQAQGLLMVLQRMMGAYFTYLLIRRFLGGSRVIAMAAGCVYSLLHTDLGEVSIMHGLNEPGVPLLLWFFWRLPLNRSLRACGTAALLGAVIGWGMSFIIGIPFIVSVLWVALQAGREDLSGVRDRLVLTVAMGVFVLVAVLPRIPELWAVALVAPGSHRVLFAGVGPINWTAFFSKQIRHVLDWWPFFCGILLWMWTARRHRKSDWVIAVLLLFGVVAAPWMDPLRNVFASWMGCIRGVDFTRFKIMAPMALTLALFSGLARWSEWGVRLTDSHGRLRLQGPLSAFIAVMFFLAALGWSVGDKCHHWFLQRYEGYNWRSLFHNSDLAEIVAKARSEGARFATAGAHQSLHPGYLLAYGAEMADGHSPIYGIRYYRFWSEVIRPLLDRDPEVRGFHQWGEYVYLHHARSGEGFSVREIPFREWYDLDLLSLAGVGYIVADKRIADERLQLLPMPIYEHRLADWGTRPLVGKIRGYLRGDNPGHRLYVYRNPAALPRGFLVPSIRKFPDQAALWHALGQARLEDLVLAVYVSEADFPGEGTVGGGPVDGHVTVLEGRRDFKRFVVSTERPAVLVISDQFYPWWRWRVNGKETKAFPAYGVFQGVVVPAGQSTVEGSYQPPYGNILHFWPSSFRWD